MQENSKEGCAEEEKIILSPKKLYSIFISNFIYIIAK
jgi:hypothetical protein